MSDDYLAHYGVKGMRWGVRKTKVYGSSASGSAYSTDKRKSGLNVTTNKAALASRFSSLSPKTKKFLGDAAFAVGTGVVTAVLSEGVLAGLAFAEIAANPAFKMLAQNAVAGAVEIVGSAAVNSVGKKISDAHENKSGVIGKKKIGGGRVAKINSIR